MANILIYQHRLEADVIHSIAVAADSGAPYPIWHELKKRLDYDRILKYGLSNL
jgi:hypothetical protein